MRRTPVFLTGLVVAAALGFVQAAFSQNSQQPAPETVRAISAPRNPLPPEQDSARVTRFSFVAYGDTRGRRDGQQEQYEHSLIVDSVLASIKRLEKTDYPIKFVVQTGDAVVNGRDPKQWNASFVELINRITTEGGVPYFLAPGNHDVTNAPTADAPLRQEGLRNYLNAVAQLIPPDGAPRRLDGYPAYAFGYGNTFFLALDSNLAADEKQFEWARKQLEGLDRKRFMNVIAFFHHPPFSSGPHGGPRVEAPTAAIRAKYLPLFRKHRVAATLTGHEHLFEHWAERYQDSEGRTYRMDHVVTGGGGAPIYPYIGTPDLREYARLYATEKVSLEQLARPGINRGDNPYHYLILKVDGDAIGLEVVGVDWGSDFQPYRSRRSTFRDSN